MTPMSKSVPGPLAIDETSVSRAYSRLLLHVLDNPGTEVAPLNLSVSDFEIGQGIPEDAGVRQALDALLLKKGKKDVEDVAFTIFPQRLWEMAQGDRKKLFAFYQMAVQA